MVPNSQVAEFKKNVEISSNDPGRGESIAWNNYWKGKFGLAERQFSL